MTGALIIKKLKSGKDYFYVKLSYKDPQTGKRKQKMLGTGLEVKGNKRRVEALIPNLITENSHLEMKASPNVADLEISVSDYTKKWLDDIAVSGVEPSTAESYAFRMRHVIDYYAIHSTKLRDLTPYSIDQFCKYLLKFGKRSQKDGSLHPMALRSVRDVKSTLGHMLNQAVIDGIIPVNPAGSVKVGGKKKKEICEEMAFLSSDECKDFIRFLATSDDPELKMLAPIAFIAIYYGLRRSEILGLKWTAIDFSKNLIHICHTVVRVKNMHVKDKTKTASSRRSLALFGTAKDILLKVEAEQNAYADYFGNTYKNKDGYVFTWEDGHSFAPDNLSDKFTRALTAFGRPELTLHKLRHTCASLLIEKGWDPKKVQYWLGHSDIQTTLNIYAHYNRQRMNDSADDLDEIADIDTDIF